MGWLLKGLFVVILCVVLFKMSLLVLAMVLPLALLVGGVMLVVWVIRKLVRGNGSEAAAVEPDEPEEARRWRVRMNRIDRRIRSLETILKSE